MGFFYDNRILWQWEIKLMQLVFALSNKKQSGEMMMI